MNIEQAKAVPLALILEKLGCKATKQKGHKAVYLSPIRIERTPSFHVHHQKNLWYDFGIGKGGNIIHLVCHYLKSENEAHTVSDALRWIENMAGFAPSIKPVVPIEKEPTEPVLILKNTKQIQHPALVQYLRGRGIPKNIADTCLVEASVQNIESKKDFFALGFVNEENGYEIRNQFFKGSVGKKSISFIRGTVPKPNGIHVFEGMMDYLSVLVYHNVTKLVDDCIVLNSLSFLQQATPYIKGYGYQLVYSWLDNDKAGQRATAALDEFLKTENDLQHKPMNELYQPYQDVNAWHKHKLSL